MTDTEIVVLLDRSGSMMSRKEDHEGGLRSFVEDQKKLAGDVKFTLIQFDSAEPCDIIYDGVPIGDVQDITLTPRGGTPLLDAIGLATSHVEKRLNAEAMDGKWPDQIVVLVITDGEENSSREWTRDRIKARIGELETKHWKFLYLGANVDAFSEAGGVGIAMSAALNVGPNGQHVRASYGVTSDKMLRARQMAGEQKTSGGLVDTKAIQALYAFDEQDRAKAKGDK